MASEPLEAAVPLRRRLSLALLAVRHLHHGERGNPCPDRRRRLTVASYAELSTHYPVSAGQAAHVRAAFQSRLLSTADRPVDRRDRRALLG
jgi:hypothetical protein